MFNSCINLTKGAYMMDMNQNCWRGKNPLIQIHHDETTVYTDQSHYWADDHVAAMKQKSLGQAIMVSEFIKEAIADYCTMMVKKHEWFMIHSTTVILTVINFLNKWTR